MKTFRLFSIFVVVALVVACGGRDERPNRDRQPTATAAANVPTSAPASAPTSAPASAPTSAPASTSNEYKIPHTYQVKVFDNYVVRDAKRNRKFSILVRYPVDAPSPLPLIVWSHGGGPNDNGHHGYNEWGTTLARAGYAVIHIAHADDDFNAHCAPLKIPVNECDVSHLTKEVSEGGTIGALWYNRPRDASAVIDDLDNIERAANLKLDRNRIGAAGHSGGAHTIMSLAGALIDVSPSVHNLSSVDARFKALIANSPQGVGRLGMTTTSWDKISVPLMIVTGAADTSQGEEATARLDPFKYIAPGTKYQLYIDSPKATHATFGLSPDGTPELQIYVAGNAIVFFDAYVRGLPEAKAWINSDKMSLWSKGVAKITAK